MKGLLNVAPDVFVNLKTLHAKQVIKQMRILSHISHINTT